MKDGHMSNLIFKEQEPYAKNSSPKQTFEKRKRKQMWKGVGLQV